VVGGQGTFEATSPADVGKGPAGFRASGSACSVHPRALRVRIGSLVPPIAEFYNPLMSRKVIIDCSPGIDDAVALTAALFDSRLEVVAITATEGSVSARTATRNVQAVVEYLDPPRLPRLGTATPPDRMPELTLRHMHGEDGLGNSGLAVAQLHQQHLSDKIICDEIRAAPEQVSILCLGPLTNIARAFKRDPGIVRL